MSLFINHVNKVLNALREAPITALSTDQTTEAWKAQEAVKDAVKRIWNAKQWSFKMRRYTFSTAASIEAYMLPRLVGEPYKIKSASSPYDIETLDEDKFDEAMPNPTGTGNPRIARFFEMAGVDTQPTAAGVVTVVSSSVSDTTQKVLIKGLVGGYLDYEQLALNGTGNVSSAKSFSQIYSVTKSAITAGRITASGDGGATTLTVLGALDLTVRLRVLRLYPIPSSVITITVKSFALPPELSHAYEDTEIPTRWDYIVDQFAYAIALRAKGIEQLVEAAKQMDLADKWLNQDMLTEEYISSEQIIVPERWGNNNRDGLWRGYAALPAGYGTLE